MEQAPVRRRLTFHLLAVVLLLPGLVLAGWRCHLRLAVEENDRVIEAAISYNEVCQLARLQGMEPRAVLASMAAEGIGSVGIVEDTLPTLEGEGRLSFLSSADRERLASEAMARGTDPRDVGSRMPPEFKPTEILVRSTESGLLERIAMVLNRKEPGLVRYESGSEYLVVNGAGKVLLASAGVGFSETPFTEASGLGLGIILRPLNHPGMTASAVREVVQNWPPPASLSAVVFAEEEVLGARGDLEAAARALRERSVGSSVPDRIGQVEFLDQSGMPELLAGLGRALPVVRVHSIGRRELNRNYDVSRATARWLRAVRDRRIKLLYIRFFLHDPISAPKSSSGLNQFPEPPHPDLISLNLRYIRGIVSGLRSTGFVLAATDAERRQELRAGLGEVPRWARIPMALALLTGLPILVGFSRRNGLPLAVFIGWSLANFIAVIVLSRSMLAGGAGLIGAVAYSSMGAIWGIRRLEDDHPVGGQARPVTWHEWGGFLVRLVLPSLLGGVLIAGLHAENTYLLHIEQFRGIKIAFLAPLLWVGLWSLRRYGIRLPAIFSRSWTAGDWALAFFLVGGTTVYLLRSGNVTFLKPSPTEDMIRTWLEELLVARPRNKEFLIGYPAAVFFLYFHARLERAWLPLWAFLLTMGQVSAVNTFCHFHSPLALAFLRGWNGLWAGLLVGSGVVILYQFVRVVSGWGRRDGAGVLLGYFGHGNLGDELLWRSFLEQARQERSDLNWRVLVSGREDEEFPDGAFPLFRSYPGEMLEALSRARCVCIPGGGVLQAVTSSRSLWYYSLLAALGTLGGGRLLLPAQGMGPWGAGVAGTLPGPLLQRLLRWLAKRAQHLSFRDLEAARAFDLLETGVPARIETDAVFRLAPPALPNLPETVCQTGSAGAAGASLRMGVVLRGSQRKSPEIARALVDWAKDNRVEIVPLVFQPGEDESPWQAFSTLGEPRIVRAGKTLWDDFGGLDLLVAMRLHGAVLATIAGIPWFGLAYDPKLAGLAGDLDWPHVVFPEAFTVAALDSFVRLVRGDRERMSGGLRQKAAERREKARDDLSRSLERVPRA